MAEKILFVDDEPHILESIKRQLRKRFTLDIAESGEEALRILKENGPFAVIVSDMRMPSMSGIELLSQVKDLYPETVRMMLTGNADQDTAIEAVNAGQIFKFLTKPCPPAIFIPSLALAQRQHRLINAEKELLQKTLKGSVNMMAELLGIANPAAFSSAVRVKNSVVKLAGIMELKDAWQLEIAALMSQVGCVTLPEVILNKLYAGKPLEDEELSMFADHPKIGAKLMEKIPRLENVTKMILLQQTPYQAFLDGEIDDVFEEVALGAQILKAAIDYDRRLYSGESRRDSLRAMRAMEGEYNPQILEGLGQIKVSGSMQTMMVKVQDITVGMVADQDIVAKNGTLIIPKGVEITWHLVQGVLNFNRKVGVVEPFKVRIGMDGDGGEDTVV